MTATTDWPLRKVLEVGHTGWGARAIHLECGHSILEAHRGQKRMRCVDCYINATYCLNGRKNPDMRHRKDSHQCVYCREE
jgi:hypothetical protein